MPEPNILLILTDQQRYDVVGSNGSEICQTPALDNLAEDGVNFRQAYSICGVCTPTRASIYTGLLPHRHSLVRNPEGLPKDACIPREVPTLAERLRTHGYRGYFVGKWHAGVRLPTACGFEGMDVPGYGDIRNDPGYLEYLSGKGLPKPDLTTLGVGWSHNLRLAGKSSGPVEASVPYYLAERAIEYLRAPRERGERFFLALNFWGPHAPYLPCEPYASMYDPRDIPPWGNFYDDLEDKPAIYRRHRDAFIGEGKAPRSWEECALWAALYFGFVTQIDAQIGRVLDALDELGLAEGTAVVFSTDHGDLTGAHGGMHDKDAVLCQELYHIPLICRHPGSQRGGSSCDLLCSNLDIPATILDVAGHPIPKALDSRSLLPILRGKEPQDWPDHVVSEVLGCHFWYDARMVVHNGFKYGFHPGGTDELYDLSRDPWEMNNLIKSGAHKEVLRACRERLIRWSKATGDPLSMHFHLFEEREPATPQTVTPYGEEARGRLRGRAPRLIQ